MSKSKKLKSFVSTVGHSNHLFPILSVVNKCLEETDDATFKKVQLQILYHLGFKDEFSVECIKITCCEALKIIRDIVNKDVRSHNVLHHTDMEIIRTLYVTDIKYPVKNCCSEEIMNIWLREEILMSDNSESVVKCLEKILTVVSMSSQVLTLMRTALNQLGPWHVGFFFKMIKKSFNLDMIHLEQAKCKGERILVNLGLYTTSMGLASYVHDTPMLQQRALLTAFSLVPNTQVFTLLKTAFLNEQIQRRCIANGEDVNLLSHLKENERKLIDEVVVILEKLLHKSFKGNLCWDFLEPKCLHYMAMNRQIFIKQGVDKKKSCLAICNVESQLECEDKITENQSVNGNGKLFEIQQNKFDTKVVKFIKEVDKEEVNQENFQNGKSKMQQKKVCTQSENCEMKTEINLQTNCRYTKINKSEESELTIEDKRAECARLGKLIGKEQFKEILYHITLGEICDDFNTVMNHKNEDDSEETVIYELSYDDNDLRNECKLTCTANNSEQTHQLENPEINEKYEKYPDETYSDEKYPDPTENYGYGGAHNEKRLDVIHSDEKHPVFTNNDEKHPAVICIDEKSPDVIHIDEKSPDLTNNDEKHPGVININERRLDLTNNDEKHPDVTNNDQICPYVRLIEKRQNDQKSPDENCNDENSLDVRHIGEKHIDIRYIDEKHSDATHSDEKHPEENIDKKNLVIDYIDEHYIDMKHEDKNYSTDLDHDLLQDVINSDEKHFDVIPIVEEHPHAIHVHGNQNNMRPSYEMYLDMGQVVDECPDVKYLDTITDINRTISDNINSKNAFPIPNIPEDSCIVVSKLKATNLIQKSGSERIFHYSKKVDKVHFINNGATDDIERSGKIDFNGIGYVGNVNYSVNISDGVHFDSIEVAEKKLYENVNNAEKVQCHNEENLKKVDKIVKSDEAEKFCCDDVGSTEKVYFGEEKGEKIHSSKFDTVKVHTGEVENIVKAHCGEVENREKICYEVINLEKVHTDNIKKKKVPTAPLR